MFAVFADDTARLAFDSILRHDNSHDVFVASVELNEVSDLRRFLGSANTDSLESSLTARQLAVGAYQRARVRSDPAEQTSEIGLAVSRITNSVGHVVVHSRFATQQCTLQLPNDTPVPKRVEQLRSIMIDMLGRDIGQEIGKHNADGRLSLTWLHESAQPHWQALLEGNQLVSGDCPERPVLFPGSFHPIHEGHRQMLALASRRLDRRVHLEITVSNADKPELDFLTIGQRVRQAESIGPVVLTKAPKFVDKARLFPGATFLIGADTAIRLDDIRFYDGCASKRDRAIRDIADHDCRFLVFGRLLEDAFLDAANLSLTHQLRATLRIRTDNGVSSRHQ